jgi:putative ABC transport system permease protein
MFKSYFKTAFRNLKKDKSHAFINIAGLSIGMAVALLIGFWIHDELSYDKNFKHYDRIAQVVQNVTNNGEVETWFNVPYPLAKELRQRYGSDFAQVVMGSRGDRHLLALGEKKFNETGAFLEAGAPALFSLDMLHGDYHALEDPTAILLSESAARAYFGDGDPMNKVMMIDSMPAVKVTGVYKDFPRNSTFAGMQFISSWEFLYNNTSWIKTIVDPWRPNFVEIYVRVNDNVSFAQVSGRIRDSKLKMVNAALQKKKPAVFLLPMSDWHLRSEFKNGVKAGGAIQYVWMFGIIGVFVLLLACINFMNLSTARSEKRAREVGIRKTVGSLRSQLVQQFFIESLSTVVFAFAVALLLTWVALPSFNEIADKELTMAWDSPFMWVSCVAFILFTALVAGSYPAVYLSSFSAVRVLKGTFKAGRFAAIPRKVLVVVQFTVSVTLIIGTIVVYRQIQFAKDRPVGYTRAGLIAIPINTAAIHSHITAVSDELLKMGAVVGLSEAGNSTTENGSSSSGFDWPGKDPGLSIDFGVTTVSHDYGKTIGWQVTSGRDFSKDFASDSSGMILNEAAVRLMNLKHPVGTIVTSFGVPNHVIGVVSDMVTGSPYGEPKPVVYGLSTDPGSDVILKINPALSVQDALVKIAPVFKRYNPTEIFQYQFADDEYAKKFGNEERIAKLASFFALFAIGISCLGLFGLVSFVAEQRKKEIGVRKVLGASLFNVWNLLSKDFVVLVIVSYFIAVPLAYFAMRSWLQNYHYRTALSLWIFLAAGAGALLITVAVVSFQAVRAAVANPVKSLRSE